MRIDSKNRIYAYVEASKFFDTTDNLKIVFFENHFSIYDQTSYKKLVEDYSNEIKSEAIAQKVLISVSRDFKTEDCNKRFTLPKQFVKEEWKSEKFVSLPIETENGKVMEIFPKSEYDKIFGKCLAENGTLKEIKGKEDEKRR